MSHLLAGRSNRKNRAAALSLKLLYQIFPNRMDRWSAYEESPASRGRPFNSLPFTPRAAENPFTAPGRKAKKAAAGQKTCRKRYHRNPAVTSTKDDERAITLSLKAVLQNLPAFHKWRCRHCSGGAAADRCRSRLIEPAVASGRISMPRTFRGACRKRSRLFQADEVKTTVIWPLEEVLKNLPATY